MNADEIVRALRCCGNTDTKKPDCEHCPLLSTRMCVKVMLEGAADLIEQQQSHIAELEQQLAASQREEQAAVENMKIIADTYREKNCDDGICGLCKFDADHGLDGYANECPGFETDDCFEWRGPQDAGEGEANA